MSLKLIPVEETPRETRAKQKHLKHFNPGNGIKNTEQKHFSLKDICLKIIRFINRGSRFTYEQIDELIESLQRSILNLQKRKQELIKEKNRISRRSKRAR